MVLKTHVRSLEPQHSHSEMGVRVQGPASLQCTQHSRRNLRDPASARQKEILS